MKKLIVEIKVPDDFDKDQVTLLIQEEEEPEIFELELGEISISDADNS